MKKRSQTKRKFYTTIVQVEILSDKDIDFNCVNLIDIAQMNLRDECSLAHKVVQHNCIGGKQMAKALRSQVNEPSFFQLTDDGEDIGIN